MYWFSELCGHCRAQTDFQTNTARFFQLKKSLWLILPAQWYFIILLQSKLINFLEYNFHSNKLFDIGVWGYNVWDRIVIHYIIYSSLENRK